MLETDEIAVSYLVLCDHAITEAGTGKQSLVGIYSALMADQLPMTANITVAVCVRVQSTHTRDLVVRVTAPDGAILFNSPSLPCDWKSVEAGIRNSGFASLQISVNLRSLPIQTEGVYAVALYAEGRLLATYPVTVLRAQAQRNIH
jgi:hypothetical protein